MMFGLSTLAIKAIAVGVVIGLLLGVFWWNQERQFNKGVQHQAEETAKGNREAIKRSRDNVKKVDDCYLIGGEWDAVSGVCK